MSSDFDRRKTGDSAGRGEKKDFRGAPDCRGKDASRFGKNPERRGKDASRSASAPAHRREGDGSHGKKPFRREGRPQRKDSPRDVALKALQDVVRGDAFAAQALDRRLDEAHLTQDDRRLAASMFYFAVENRLYIEQALAPYIKEKPEPIVTDILHIAAAQLLFMDRVPDHAAVDEAVKQTRANHREGFTGLVNAVLRRLIDARDVEGIRLPNRDEDPAGWLSARYSFAPAVARALIDAYGLEEAERLAAWQPRRRAQTIRPNRARMDGAAFEAWLDGKGMKWKRGAVADAYIIEDAGSLAQDGGYRRGDFSIQGESAMLAAQAVQARPGMQILDACAAPGGKTCLMAERMNGAGRVYAWDVHPHRVELIRAAAKRLGLDNIRPSEHDARKPLDSMHLAMDAVLVDAPCSGLGVIAEKPDIKYRQSAESLEALPGVQAQILDACAGAVKMGGLLVYATCTVLPAENEGQITAFLERHPSFVPDCDGSWLPEALRPQWREGMIQILPQRDGLEGFFIARLRRKGV